MALTIKVETTGQFRQGLSAKNNKPWFMAEAYAHLPGVPYPQRMTYYAAAQSEIRPAGMYECDVIVGVKDDRLHFECDPRQGRVISNAAAPSSVKSAS
jgi:hypothetical protein